MFTLELELAQGGLAIVHLKVFTPRPNPVMVVVGDKELVIVPEPARIDHDPIPLTATFAAIVTDPVEIQIV